MSAEGKKKRGESGQKNAAGVPFRYGGSRCNYSTRTGGTTHPRLGGSALVNAMKYGAMVLPLLGYREPSVSARLWAATDEAMAKCTSHHLATREPSRRAA